MQRIYHDTRPLDAACRERYGLSEDVMMENAALALERQVRECLQPRAPAPGQPPALVLVLAGGGGNGADGWALARRMAGADVRVAVCMVREPKTALCQAQRTRAEGVGVERCAPEAVPALLPAGRQGRQPGAEGCRPAAVVVDCIFGSGFHGGLPQDVAAVLDAVNGSAAYRIACDVPTGVGMDGACAPSAFRAACTVTMGALKMAFYSDAAKDCCGTIVLAPLGVGRHFFEAARSDLPPAGLLLEIGDMDLPLRTRQNVHKGSFGHVAVVAGDRPGAGVIAAQAALRFGAGLVTLVDAAGRFQSGSPLPQDGSGAPPCQPPAVPYELMCGADVPAGTSAVALGMGLGRGAGAAAPYVAWLDAHPHVPCVLDADMFYAEGLRSLLERRQETGSLTVLTPHPKEFAALLDSCGMGVPSVEEAVARRVELVRAFCREFPGVALLLKGATVLIGCRNGAGADVFVNPHGSAALAKAGSGDVLAGMVAALLAQGYGATAACQTASLAHALAGGREPAAYGLTPFALIQRVAELGERGTHGC